MRIVLATEALTAVGGTETYVVTVAEHLMRLGHDVRVYAPHLGEMAELARERRCRGPWGSRRARSRAGSARRAGQRGCLRAR